jgi:hypothetical protein
MRMSFRPERFYAKLAAESPVCGRQQTHGYHRYDRVLRLNGYEIRFVDRDLYDWLMQLYDTNNVNRSSLEV